MNLCNAYDKQEIIPEMLELAKFAKRHVPEQHELDDPDFVHKRVDVRFHLPLKKKLYCKLSIVSDFGQGRCHCRFSFSL